jgi:MerR family regulatory protein
MGMMDIGDVAERSGVPPSTLRYYEEIGLIRSISRHGLRRQFDSDVLLTLSLIELGKTAGFSLTEIGGMSGIIYAPKQMICSSRCSTCGCCGMPFGTWPNVQPRRIWNVQLSASS